MMTKEQVILRLEEMANDQELYHKAAGSKRRKLRPSERAMALAHYQMNLEALRFAIGALKYATSTEKEPVL
jgi:hypothetical protein